MFKTLAKVFDCISKKLTALDDAWEKKKPAVEDSLIDLSLDLEDTVRTTLEALAWMGKGTARGARKAVNATRRTYRAVKAMGAIALPVIRKMVSDASMKLYEALRATHGYLAPVRSNLENRFCDAWSFREELLREAKA